MASWSQLGTQALGIVVVGAAAFTSAYLLFYLLKITVGIRVTKEHEIEGLDSHEHGIRGYTITHE